MFSNIVTKIPTTIQKSNLLPHCKHPISGNKYACLINQPRIWDAARYTRYRWVAWTRVDSKDSRESLITFSLIDALMIQVRLWLYHERIDQREGYEWLATVLIIDSRSWNPAISCIYCNTTDHIKDIWRIREKERKRDSDIHYEIHWTESLIWIPSLPSFLPGRPRPNDAARESRRDCVLLRSFLYTRFT